MMKLARTIPQLPDASARAAAIGFEGVECFVDSQFAGSLPSDLNFACLSSAITINGNADHDYAAAEQCRALIELAAANRCAIIRIAGRDLHKRENRSTAAVGFGRWLEPLADFAAERGVNLLIENALGFAPAARLWGILERLNHPAVGCCYDVASAISIGETPILGIPTLNSKIELVRLAADLPESVMRDVLDRLRGVGFDGWLSVSTSDATTDVSAILKKLDGWRVAMPAQGSDAAGAQKIAAAT